MAAMACSRAQIFSDAETGPYNALPHAGREYSYDSDDYGSKCFCCPYGYHIDLDFVRYCETWQADASDRLQHERRRRRARHKQRQSMEFLLGLPDENKAAVYQPPAEPSKKPVPPKPPPKPSLDSIRLNQDWQDSLSNFEEALSQSYSGPSSSACSTPINNVYLSTAVDSSPPVQNGVDCVSSPSSRTEMVAPVPPQRNESHSYLRKAEATGAAAAAAPTSSRLVLESASRVENESNRPCLQSIREQMAAALERMKQLEEQVKEIPLLHVQMSVLREERRILLRQLASQKKLNHQQPQQTPVSKRDAATSCAVVTRDVGVTHQPMKLRDSSTSTLRVLSAHATEVTSIAPEAKPPSSTQSTQSTQCSPQARLAKAVQSESPGLVALATKSTQYESECSTERSNLTAKGTQCSVETRERGTSSLQQPIEISRPSVARRNKEVQATESQPWVKLKLNAGVSAKPSVCDVATETCDTSISLSALRRQQTLGGGKSVSTSVGRDLVRTVSRSTETLTPRSRDFGTSPRRKLLVDVSVGGSLPFIATSTNYCDECKQINKNKQQQQQQQQQHSKTDKGKGYSMRTRIPVMSADAKNERRSNLIRQDTWTESLDKLGDGSQSLNKHADRQQQQQQQQEQQLTASSKKRDGQVSQDSLAAEPQSKAKEEEEGKAEELDDALVRSVVLDTPKVPANKPPMDLSKEMRAALKVLDDNLRKVSAGGTLPSSVKNASNIVQHEWFKVSSTAQADPHSVEYYLDQFEQHCSSLLDHVVNLRDSNGNTAMHYAVSHGNFDVVSILLDSKVCDVNGTNHAGYTPVMLAALVQLRNSTHASVVKRLFQLADVNVRAKLHGQTALMLAVSHGRKDMSKLLLDAGAAVNLQDEDGSTALMCAAEHGHADIVRLLLAHSDCDSSIVDVDGSTALKIAVEAGHAEVGMLLYAHQRASRASPMPPTAPKLGRRQRTISAHHNHHAAQQYSVLSMSAPASPVATASRKFHSSSLSLVEAPKYSL
ncbi:KN motif and ankyrin repeat domain-containing protein 2-like isoform X2 [Phymastichus coffea]|uniref:KN motif and ankyrin repeat domain-containing protein 2-like isoform X2 n=1 Tax=Phymastichus coffea TaxID=108790 RepID=UPI00273B9D83|nr:KN motif and ankyrin repeat domain-containing protein 2-like isoform X2 [Phymastichus coffea]